MIKTWIAIPAVLCIGFIAIAYQPRGKLAFAGHARGVWAASDRAYVAASAAPGIGSEFVIVDISDPGSPVKLASIETPGGAQDVFVRGELAFVADRNRGIVTIDLSDERRPVVIDRYRPGDGVNRDVVGNADILVFPSQTGLRTMTLRLARFAKP